jgi:Phosphotransferase enzyme family
VEQTWREDFRGYLVAHSPGGRLFGRWSDNPVDQATLEHEAAVREIVGAEGALRTPRVLDRGGSWLLEEAIDSEPCEGPENVDAVAAAAERIPQLDLPPAPMRFGRRGGTIRRRVRLLRSPLPLRDVRASRRTLADPALPVVTSHGDFHRGNVLLKDETAWVVDWELSGERPAGYDLMRFWSTLEQAEDRDRLFEATVEFVGAVHRPALLRLRHALVVRTIAAKFSSSLAFDRDVAGAHELLALLPAVRAEAGLR